MQQRITILLASILLFIGGKSVAQDAHFSQFFANPIYLNPAFAGTNVCPRISLHFRDQWPNIPSTFVTYTASYDQHFDKIAGGVGAILFADRAGRGTINTYSASLMYSYRLKVSQKFQMRFAIQASYLNRNLDWDKLTFGDMIDSRYGFVYETNEAPKQLSYHSFDLAAGFIGYTDYLYFGFAAHHLTMPYDGFVSPTSRIPIKWTGHVGAYIDLKRKSKLDRTLGDIALSPNIIYQHQGTFKYLNTGLSLIVHPFTVGLWLRNSFTKKDPLDALIFMVGFQHERIRVGYSYDITLGKLSNVTGGAHEVSLQILLRCPEKVRTVKDLNCPAF